MADEHPLRVVIVEDSASSALEEELRSAFAGIQVEIFTCESDFHDALRAIVANPPDLFIIDMLLRWTTPRPQMPPRPPHATRYRAGVRCVQALLASPAKEVPVIIHSVLERAEIAEMTTFPTSVSYVQKGNGVAATVRAVLETTRDLSPPRKRVFVVHGHHKEVRIAVVELLERLELEPVVLVDQAATGKTFIELLEQHSNVAFAVVLLTADDLGREKTKRRLKPRARQNVIMELGFFIAKLGRDKVCTLHEEGVDVPTDYQAVKYIALDIAGTWKQLLAKALAIGGIDVDVTRIV